MTAMRARKLRSVNLASIAAFLIFLYYRFSYRSNSAARATPTACPQSPLLKDTLVVLRTGATESHEKLPNHRETTLACVPDYIIYSDYEENIGGNHIHDVLDEVNSTIKARMPEFKLYDELREKGRDGLVYQTAFGSSANGALDNPGWKLDKWKFLPMVDRALKHRPNAKWFVFIESDTYMIWSNVLQYLSKFDPGKPYYIGKHMYIGDVLFAHGGSGFALSSAALERVARHWREHKTEFEDYTAEQWAGDMVLGKALRDVDIQLFWAFPHFQGDSVPGLNWNITKIDRQPWCYAPLSFHHMARDDFRAMWSFEQRRLTKQNRALRFRDVFKEVVYPSLQAKRDDWDNMSVGTEYSEEATAKLAATDAENLSAIEKKAHLSFDNCRAACEGKKSCLQLSYISGKCLISTELRLGHSATAQCLEYSIAASSCSRFSEGSVSSGWLMDRVENYVLDLDARCEGPDGNDWVT